MNRLSVAIASVCVTSLGAAALAQVALIDREVFFGNPERAALRVSPDGAHISYLAPLDGVLNVWIAPVGETDNARAVTNDQGRGVRQYFWAHTGEHILYLQDVGGDENWQIHSVNIATGEDKNLTPFESIPGADGEPQTGAGGKVLRPTARVSQTSERFPHEIVIGLNNRDPMYHDVYRVDIITGEMEMLEQNEGYLGYLIDDEYNVRFSVAMTPDGGTQIYRKGENGFVAWQKIDGDDMLTTNPIGFNSAGDTLYMVDSRGRDTAALVAVDPDTGEKTTIFADPRADVSSVAMNPRTQEPQAVAINHTRVEWSILDPAIEADGRFIGMLDEGDVNVTSRSQDDRYWTLAYVRDDGPVKYYLYDREGPSATYLFSNRPQLESLPLAKMHPVVIKSRDGLDLVSYLTLPVWADPDGDGRPDEALPTMLWVHGGPWARDSWGYNSVHQWLANRGYAVLSVNYRGSTGFGKDFINAANMEWAGKMHDDLIDAVDWMIEEGIADADRVAIGGGSYGGYATLVGLTFTPEKFACGVDIVGPSNLRTLLDTIPEYWKPTLDFWATRVGDPRTGEGRAFLDTRSPLTHVDKIERPLLIGQGANDPRVKQSESDQIVEAMQRSAIPVTYVLYPDEGHGFARPENRMSFFAVTEAFLAEHLGGRFQPLTSVEGSSILVPQGAEHVSGLGGVIKN